MLVHGTNAGPWTMANFEHFDANQTTRIDYQNVTCLVLMVSGSEDLAIPPSTSRVIAQRHGSLAPFYGR